MKPLYLILALCLVGCKLPESESNKRWDAINASLDETLRVVTQMSYLNGEARAAIESNDQRVNRALQPGEYYVTIRDVICKQESKRILCQVPGHPWRDLGTADQPK